MSREKMYVIYNPANGKRVSKARGYDRTESLIDRIESAGKHVAPLAFDDFDAARHMTYVDTDTNIRTARHIATVADGWGDVISCTHDGLFGTSGPLDELQFCPRCTGWIPNRDL